LLGAAAVCLLVGLQLVLAATGDDRSPWDLMPVPDDAADRGLLLVGIMLVLIVTIGLLARPRTEGLSLAANDGAILVPHRALVELVEDSFALHPDVVRARARVAAEAGTLSLEAHVLLRPEADVATLGPLVQAQGVAAVTSMTGLTPEVRRVRFKVLRVTELARHL
jgi:hypothetical protein